MSVPALCQECPLCGRPRMAAAHFQKPDVLFVGGYPLETDVKNGAFMGKNSSLLRKLIQTMQSKRSPGRPAAHRLRLCVPVQPGL